MTSKKIEEDIDFTKKTFLRLTDRDSTIIFLDNFIKFLKQGNMMIDEFQEIVAKRELEWKTVVQYYMELPQYKDIAIWFFYLIELKPRVPWAIAQKELLNEINSGVGKKLKISYYILTKAFEDVQGEYMWSSMIDDLLGKVKVAGMGKRSVVPLYLDVRELLLRVLLMGNEVDNRRVRDIKSLYFEIKKKKGRSITPVFIPHASRDWFIKEMDSVKGFKPPLKDALEMLYDPDIVALWNRWRKEGKAIYYLEK